MAPINNSSDYESCMGSGDDMDAEDESSAYASVASSAHETESKSDDGVSTPRGTFKALPPLPLEIPDQMNTGEHPGQAAPPAQVNAVKTKGPSTLQPQPAKLPEIPAFAQSTPQVWYHNPLDKEVHGKKAFNFNLEGGNLLHLHRDEKEMPGQKRRRKEVRNVREEPLFLPDQESSLHEDVSHQRMPTVSPYLVAYDFVLMSIAAKAQTGAS